MQSDEKYLSVKAKQLLLTRVFVATFLLGIAAFIEIQGIKKLFTVSQQAIYYIIASAYLTSIIVAWLQNKCLDEQKSIWLIAAIDQVLVTLLVHYTGGALSIYSIFYSLVVIYAALLAGKKAGYAIAAFGGILYGMLLSSEHAGFVHTVFEYEDYKLTAQQVFAKFFIHTASLFVIAVLTSFVSEREKKLRTMLSESEDAFKQLDFLHRNIIESVDAGVLTFDLQGKIKTINRAASEITELSENEALAKNITDIFPDLFSILSLNSEIKYGQRFEMIIPGKDTAGATIGFSLSPLLDQDGNKIARIMVFQDITAIKQMEQQIEKSKKMALIGELAAGLAHEMRNPLAAMGGSIQVLRKGLRLSESDERLMQIILRGKEQLDVFLRDFLLLARPNREVRESIDPATMISEVLETLRYGQDWNEQIKLKYTPGTGSRGAFISGNSSEIRQALMNVILNAVQSMPEGGLLTIRQDFASSNGSSFLNVAIEDTGCGIEKEQIGKIFEPFYTTKARGTGLGLAIVGRVIESHGGKVHVHSKPGEGTRIDLRFPVGSEAVVQRN